MASLFDLTNYSKGLLQAHFAATFTELARTRLAEEAAIGKTLDRKLSGAAHFSKVQETLKSANPFAGIQILPFPGGVDSPRYRENKVQIKKLYAERAQQLNSRIGTEFPPSQTAIIKITLSDSWGGQVGLHLPFTTGLEQDWVPNKVFGPVLEISPAERFVIRGFAYNRAAFSNYNW